MELPKQEERETSPQTYYCIWDEKIICKIRTIYKLKPESLILFCQNCTELPLNKSKCK